MEFEPDSVKAVEIHNEANYPGLRVTLLAIVSGARCHIQADIGFGDAVTPDPEDATYPVILNDLDAPKLRVYTHYTVVAEKFEALSTLGIANSRMKDYFDLWVMAQRSAFDGDKLQQSLQATFAHRQSPFPADTPVGLTEAFALDDQKQIQWKAFLAKNGLQAVPLQDVVEFIVALLMPVVRAVCNGEPFTDLWPAGGPWSSVKNSSSN